MLYYKNIVQANFDSSGHDLSRHRIVDVYLYFYVEEVCFIRQFLPLFSKKKTFK